MRQNAGSCSVLGPAAGPCHLNSILSHKPVSSVSGMALSRCSVPHGLRHDVKLYVFLCSTVCAANTEMAERPVTLVSQQSSVQLCFVLFKLFTLSCIQSKALVNYLWVSRVIGDIYMML